jgi:hypothetical protein
LYNAAVEAITGTLADFAILRINYLPGFSAEGRGDYLFASTSALPAVNDVESSKLARIVGQRTGDLFRGHPVFSAREVFACPAPGTILDMTPPPGAPAGYLDNARWAIASCAGVKAAP